MNYHNRFSRGRKIQCINCGNYGHDFKECKDPITSYGIINIDILDNTNELLMLKDKFSNSGESYYKIVSNKYPDIICYLSDNIRLDDNECIYQLDNESLPFQNGEQIQKFSYYRNKILFMMVSRKFSLGFIEFIRGKYNVFDSQTIINLFEQMYENEIRYIKEHQEEYDILLYHFLNTNNEPKETVLNRIYESKYSNEYYNAKHKFNILAKSSNDENCCIMNLNFYINHIKPKWKTPEWGFPKGRKEKRSEENIVCACREFEEETGYHKDEYCVLNKIEPLEENMVGTDGINYKHIYYLTINNRDRNLEMINYDTHEIGNIKWFTYDEAMIHIRPYHREKKRLLTRVYLFILNYLVHCVP
jgi:8-oxo-dGTP pyrophosphatase MutT (NUDIX family)